MKYVKKLLRAFLWCLVPFLVLGSVGGLENEQMSIVMTGIFAFGGVALFIILILTAGSGSKWLIHVEKDTESAMPAEGATRRGR